MKFSDVFLTAFLYVFFGAGIGTVIGYLLAIVCANGASGSSIADLPPLEDRCDVILLVTVPPGITKPMGRCINRKPCALPGHAS
jgi:hypothetical protein